MISARAKGYFPAPIYLRCIRGDIEASHDETAAEILGDQHAVLVLFWPETAIKLHLQPYYN